MTRKIIGALTPIAARAFIPIKRPTISASVKQIEDIKLIKKKKKIDKLSEGERALAEARLKNPNSTLSELGKLVTPNISKSGVTHRLENIAKLANELR